jgi:enoyl-CoA hydratase
MSDADVFDEAVETLVVDRDRGPDAVVTVSVERPESRNALNATVRSELKRVLPAVENSDARVLVLTGSEECNCFVAGADVTEFKGRDHATQRRVSDRPRIYETLANLRIPTIARLNGHTLGGGLELATACDVRIASEGAKLGQPEINLGILPGGGGTQRLPRLIGEGQTMRLVLSGDLIDAAEAHDIGLVDVLCDRDDLDEEVYDLAESMARHHPTALEFNKRAVQAASRMSLDAGIDHEVELFLQLFGTDLKEEGIAAFLEDREPNWRP